MMSDVETRVPLRYRSQIQNMRGKAVVIVGDSAGIGRAAAEMLAEGGARIFFAARTPAELSRALAALEQEGSEWDGIVVNFSQQGEVRHLFDLALHRMGKIDALILPPAANDEGLQRLCEEEATQHLRSGTRIINIETADLLPN